MGWENNAIRVAVLWRYFNYCRRLGDWGPQQLDDSGRIFPVSIDLCYFGAYFGRRDSKLWQVFCDSKWLPWAYSYSPDYLSSLRRKSSTRSIANQCRLMPTDNSSTEELIAIRIEAIRTRRKCRIGRAHERLAGNVMLTRPLKSLITLCGPVTKLQCT